MLSHRFPVIIHGVQYYLANNLRAWLFFERETGRQIGDVGGGPEVLRALLWALVRAGQIARGTTDNFVTLEFIGSVAGEELQALMRAVEVALYVDLPKVKSSDGAAETRRVDWHELWAIGRYDLHLSDEEFWSLTPLQFHSLVARFDAQCDREFMAAGVVASMVGNCHLAQGADPLTPDMFVPHRGGEDQSNDAEQSAILLAKINAMKAIMPGRVPIAEVASGTR
jgi:hypothetical protein